MIGRTNSLLGNNGVINYLKNLNIQIIHKKGFKGAQSTPYTYTATENITLLAIYGIMHRNNMALILNPSITTTGTAQLSFEQEYIVSSNIICARLAVKKIQLHAGETITFEQTSSGTQTDITYVSQFIELLTFDGIENCVKNLSSLENNTQVSATFTNQYIQEINLNNNSNLILATTLYFTDGWGSTYFTSNISFGKNSIISYSRDDALLGTGIDINIGLAWNINKFQFRGHFVTGSSYPISQLIALE